MEKFDIGKSSKELERIKQELKPYISDSGFQKLFKPIGMYGSFNKDLIDLNYEIFNNANHDSDYAKLLYNMLLIRLYIDYTLSEKPLYIYQNNQNSYDLTTFIDSRQGEFLLFDLKMKDDKKVDMIFYDDTLSTKELREAKIERAKLNFELNKNTKKPIDEIKIGGSDSLIVMRRLNNIITAENKILYADNKDKNAILTRKNIIDYYTEQFDSNVSYHEIPEDKKKDGNKVLIKSYPYMDMSVKYKK